MLVVGLNHSKHADVTPSTVFGPFFVDGSPAFANGDDIANGAPGEPCLVHGRILSVTGEPVAGARIEVWQADDDGFYDVQHDGLDEPRGRGHLYSESDGRFWFWSVKPQHYPIPSDGPVGRVCSAPPTARRCARLMSTSWSAPSATRRSPRTCSPTAIPYLDSDAVFGVKSELVAPVVRHEPGRAPDGREFDGPYWSITYDIVLAPAGS